MWGWWLHLYRSLYRFVPVDGFGLRQAMDRIPNSDAAIKQ
jgi:hypothetical protein